MQIKFDNVFYTYNKKTPFEYDALRGISFELEENKVTAIVGKTGSGKSTLAQHMNGLLLPTNGKVFAGNFVLSSDKKIRSKNYKTVRKSIGLVFQFPEYQLFEETVEKDIAFGPLNFGVSKEQLPSVVEDAIKQVGLDPSFLKRSPFELSGGEKRRVAIAGVLACKPDILVVDEPTAGLDNAASKNLLDKLKELTKSNISVVIITHDMEVVSRYADNVIVMENGTIAFNGKPNELFKQDVSKLSLGMPKAIAEGSILIKKGLKIDLKNVVGVSSLVDEIVRVYK